MSSVAFVIIALVLLFAAVSVVTTRNLVHSVFWLALVLISTAGLYITLDASFLAAIQVLLYAGGVITLMLFGIMLTARHNGVIVPNLGESKGVGALTAIALFGLLMTGIWRTDMGDLQPMAAGTAADVGKLFLGQHVLAFEVLSVLLLAGMIGAIVLTRNSDP